MALKLETKNLRSFIIIRGIDWDPKWILFYVQMAFLLVHKPKVTGRERDVCFSRINSYKQSYRLT